MRHATARETVPAVPMQCTAIASTTAVSLVLGSCFGVFSSIGNAVIPVPSLDKRTLAATKSNQTKPSPSQSSHKFPSSPKSTNFLPLNSKSPTRHNIPSTTAVGKYHHRSYKRLVFLFFAHKFPFLCSHERTNERSIPSIPFHSIPLRSIPFHSSRCLCSPDPSSPSSGSRWP